MLPLVLAGILFMFLLVGSAVFLVCLPLPRPRQYALSAALWCAVWGPSSIILMGIAGAGLIPAAFLSNPSGPPTYHTPRLLSVFGWSYLVIGVLISTGVATASALIHQAVVRRFTFIMFRAYATIVVAGMGSVFGLCLGWWIMVEGLNGYSWLFVWIICMLALMAGFAVAAYKGSRGLRGEAPKRFAWLSQTEYVGDGLSSESLTPNKQTVEAMKAARRGDLVKVGSIESLMSDLHMDD